jgi:hypothetical protein
MRLVRWGYKPSKGFAKGMEWSSFKMVFELNSIDSVQGLNHHFEKRERKPDPDDPDPSPTCWGLGTGCRGFAQKN